MLPDLSKVVAAALAGESDDDSASTVPSKPLLQSKMDSLSPVIDFLEGKNCLTGVSHSTIIIVLHLFSKSIQKPGFLSKIKKLSVLKIFVFLKFLGHWLVAIRILLWPLRAPIPCGQEW